VEQQGQSQNGRARRVDARSGWVQCCHGGWQWRREVGGCLFSWVPVYSHGNSSNLTFPLEPGWTFVETEDWRVDIEAKWCEVGADDCECFPVVHTAVPLMFSVIP